MLGRPTFLLLTFSGPFFWGKKVKVAGSLRLGVMYLIHQIFQVPKMEVLTYISSMDRAYARKTHPQNSRKYGSGFAILGT